MTITSGPTDEVATAATTAKAARTPSTGPAAAAGGETAAGVKPAVAASVTASSENAEPRENWTTHLPGVGAGPGLTGPGAIVLSFVVAGLGASLDLMAGDELSLAFSATFLLASVLTALVVRPAAMLTAVILPPLVFASLTALAAKSAGQVRGSRELGMETATGLALAAPVLFTGTALALAVVLVRLVVRLVRR